MVDLNLDAEVINAVDPINRAFADVLVHSFASLSLRSNLPLDVTAAYSSQFHDNQSKFFLFTSLLTLLQDLTEFLMSRVVVWLAPLALFPHHSGVKRFVVVITRAF